MAFQLGFANLNLLGLRGLKPLQVLIKERISGAALEPPTGSPLYLIERTVHYE